MTFLEWWNANKRSLAQSRMEVAIEAWSAGFRANGNDGEKAQRDDGESK
jgi:hypothetical protein